MAASVPALWTCTACGALGLINKRAWCRSCGAARPQGEIKVATTIKTGEPMERFRAHWNGGAMFVKAEGFFQQQRKQDPVWGNGAALTEWHPITAINVEEARRDALIFKNSGHWPPPTPPGFKKDELIPMPDEAPKTQQQEDAEQPRELLAARLIDAWCEAHGTKIPWDKAIKIVAVITKMDPEEEKRLLNL